MEKQCAMILLLILIFLLTPKALVFAEETNAASQTVRYKLANMARSFLGLPYRWGGLSERRGVDCSGLVQILFAKLHIQLPRTSSDQVRSGENIAMQDLQTGDLVFFLPTGRLPTT